MSVTKQQYIDYLVEKFKEGNTQIPVYLRQYVEDTKDGEKITVSEEDAIHVIETYAATDYERWEKMGKFGYTLAYEMSP